ncbi:MAG TPA: GNAT family N-acetyltransferase [bacterium]|nr:GNAT family N-acetyltransferase [bacterium]HPN45886.1 GNAT family N-acetyltransferase [bacterium]
MPYAIRHAIESDLACLSEIEKRAAVRFAEYDLEKIMSTITTPPDAFAEGLTARLLWVAADDNDSPVGFALACAVGNTVHLDELDVLPEHGRRGLGTRLVETVCDWARTHHYKAVTLTTLSHIPWNGPWYERQGFRVLSPHEYTPLQAMLLQTDIIRGLPEKNRVIMRRDLY